MKRTITGFLLSSIILFSCEKGDPKVNADFSVNTQIIEVGTTIQFTDNSTGEVNSWDWVFEGGTPNTSELQDPSVTYNTPGTFDVALTAKNASRNGTMVKQDYITVYDLYDGLVAYYPFSGTAEDSSPVDLDGIINGAIFTTDRNETSNSALLFDGINDYVDCSVDNRGITSKFTISVWIQKTTTSAIECMVSKYDWTFGYLFRVFDTGLTSLGGKDGSGEYYSTGTSTTQINDGAWHHLVTTVDVNTWHLWVDGIKEAIFNTTTSSPNFASNDPLVIGVSTRGSQGDPEWFFTGKIDDVAIYNRALTDIEIEAIRLYGL